MRPLTVLFLLVAPWLLAAPALAQEGAASVVIAKRQVRCDNVRTLLDRRLPNLGAAEPDRRILILNPRLLERMSDTVQLFVFHHECGHHQIGASELAADCWAVGRGLRDGWLDGAGLKQVCGSFGNAPETATHPSAARRCANLDRCFATASAEVARERPQTRVRIANAEPQLVTGPRLLWAGRNGS